MVVFIGCLFLIFTKNVSERKCPSVNSKKRVLTGTSIYPCALFQPPSNFNFMERFEELLLKKNHPKFFIVNSKEKDMTSENSLSEDLIHMKARYNHCVSVLKPYLCLLVFFLLIEIH